MARIRSKHSDLTELTNRSEGVESRTQGWHEQGRHTTVSRRGPWTDWSTLLHLYARRNLRACWTSTPGAALVCRPAGADQTFAAAPNVLDRQPAEAQQQPVISTSWPRPAI